VQNKKRNTKVATDWTAKAGKGGTPWEVKTKLREDQGACPNIDTGGNKQKNLKGGPKKGKNTMGRRGNNGARGESGNDAPKDR